MGRTFKGKLEPHFETGTEGVIWSLDEDIKLPSGLSSYDGLHHLKNGDLLRVFGADGSKIWEGPVDLEFTRRYKPFPGNPEHGQQQIRGMWVHGFQRNLDPETWAGFFFDRLDAEMTEKDSR